MADIFSALGQLGTFDHAACDRIINSGAVQLQFLPHKPNELLDLAIGAAFVTLWMAAVIWATYAAYRHRPDKPYRYRMWRWWGPLMIALGVFSFYRLGQELVEYVSVCRSVVPHQ